MTRPEPQQPGTETTPVIDLTQPFAESDLYTLRAAVTAHAHAGGIAPSMVDSLLIIVGELASNAIRHGGGTGTMRLWTDDGDLFCQISDQGPGITDPEHAGREPVPPTTAGGRGLWIVRQLSHDVTIASTTTGTVVTATVRIPAVTEQ